MAFAGQVGCLVGAEEGDDEMNMRCFVTKYPKADNWMRDFA